MGQGRDLPAKRIPLATLAAVLGIAFGLAPGCYEISGSSGGGEVRAVGERRINPSDVELPPGYQIEAIAQGLNFPTGVAIDAQGRIYVVEAGYCYGEVWTTPRLLRIERGGA